MKAWLGIGTDYDTKRLFKAKRAVAYNLYGDAHWCSKYQ